MATNTETGRFGEEIALRLLYDKGYTIHERNWRYRNKEVDIIAQEGNELVIVEVKLRNSNRYGTALQAITEDKKQNLIIAANHYIQSHRLKYSVRYDIIAIDIAPDKSYKVEHIRRAFYPTQADASRSSRYSLRNRIPKIYKKA